MKIYLLTVRDSWKVYWNDPKEDPHYRISLKKMIKFVRLLLLSANQNFSLSFVYRMLKFVSRTLETCKFYDVFLCCKYITHHSQNRDCNGSLTPVGSLGVFPRVRHLSSKKTFRNALIAHSDYDISVISTLFVLFR